MLPSMLQLNAQGRGDEAGARSAPYRAARVLEAGLADFEGHAARLEVSLSAHNEKEEQVIYPMTVARGQGALDGGLGPG
jgi:hypothetical protein